MADCNHEHITTIKKEGYKVVVCEDCGEEME